MSSFIFPNSLTRKYFGMRGKAEDRAQKKNLERQQNRAEMFRKLKGEATPVQKPTSWFKKSYIAWIIFAIIVLLMLILSSCVKASVDKPINSTKIDYFDVQTFEHDGCLWIMATHKYSAVSLVHHPRCTNHETKFR